MDIRRRLVSSTKIAIWCFALTALFGLSSLLLSSSASAVVSVPTKMNFQGRLTDSAGNAKPDGSYNMKLRLFNVSSGGAAIWSEDRLVSAGNGVQLRNGLFSIQPGSVAALSGASFQSAGLYLEIELASPATATSSSPLWTEGPMTPRNQMTTSAYAFNSETLDGLDSSAFGQLSAHNTFTGLNTFRPSAGSGTAFRVQNAGGSDIISVDTLTGSTSIKTSTSGTPLRLWGTNTGVSNVAVMGFYDSAGTRIGYLGDGFTGAASMYLQADAGNSVNLGINGGTSLNVDSSGNVQIGTQHGNMTGHALVVANTSATPLAVRRNSQDGNLISFYRDSTLQGSVSVAGATVSYNAFTGSHYGWLEGPSPDKGTLVTMTGDNQYVGEQGSSEIVYGMAPTTTANDSAVLGSYLALSEPSKPFDRATNQHQIMSVGNGEMWVAENDGGNIQPGDDLISSTVTGHAMKDPGTYLVSNVVARASEKVDWSKVTTKVNGVKHARISVLFGAYTKNNVGQAQGLSGSNIHVGSARVKTLALDGHFIGNGDTRGRVKVPAGQTSATYHFREAFGEKPVVVASPEGGFVPYYVSTNTESLTVHLNESTENDQWFTFMVQE